MQTDAPANARAYWTCVPIQSRALLLAKAAVIIAVLLLPPLIGQFFAIGHYGISGARTVTMMIASGSVYGAWLLLAMLVASLTKRFTGFTATLLGIPALFALLATVVARSPWRVLTSHVPGAAIGLVTVLVAASMLLLVYSRRKVGNAWLGAGALVVASGLLAITAPTRNAIGAPLPPTNVPPITMEIAPVDLRPFEAHEEQSLDFNVTGMTRAYHYALLVDSS